MNKQRNEQEGIGDFERECATATTANELDVVMNKLTSVGLLSAREGGRRVFERHFSASLFSDLLLCSSYLAPDDKTKFFIASDSAAFSAVAKKLFGDRVIETDAKALHTSQTHSEADSMKIALDWYLMSKSNSIVSVGDKQSTYSASAWHMSLRATQMHYTSDDGQCMIGGAGMFNLRTSYHLDDPALKRALNQGASFGKGHIDPWDAMLLEQRG
jgi:hypothetical protein